MSDYTLVRDGAFLVADVHGDVGDEGVAGLFHRDTRHLSCWRLTLDGVTPALLSGADHGSGATIVSAAAGERGALPPYEARRMLAVHAGGLAEQLRLVGHEERDRTVEVRYLAGADFADQFELRGDRTYPRHTVREARIVPDGLVLGYARDDFRRTTRIAADPAPDVVTEAGDGTFVLVWTVPLAPGAEWTLSLAVTADDPAEPTMTPAPVVATAAATDVEAFLAPALRRLAGPPDLVTVAAQGLRDLAALRIRVPGTDLRPVSAGVPWFLCLFGRDSLIASLMAMPYLPDLAADTLRAHARYQGTRYDPARIEEPGKIVHEVRAGELAHFGDVPYGRYYGTVDATPLFLVALGEHHRVTGDQAPARDLETAARAAVDWMIGDGGLDRHGYLVYRTDLPGLVHQCWKDSPTGICHPDGSSARGPVAACEVQGYAYDALRRTAVLAREVWHDPVYADRLDARAGDLRTRFRTDFWCEETGYPALALDGDRRQVTTVASNPGHLLWSGILDDDLAAAVGDRLLAPDLFSGWGIRTLATGQRAYHPISYHRGGVWPHDTALCVAGLARYGMTAHAERVARGLIDAATAGGGRLPELVTGHDRAGTGHPVRYPHACSPQAWSAASSLLLATALGYAHGSGEAEQGTGTVR